MQIPQDEDPLEADPPDADIPWMQILLDTDPPEVVPPRAVRALLEADPPGYVTCDACWEANPSPYGQTNTCENIALPQTSFAGSNKSLVLFEFNLCVDEEDVLVLAQKRNQSAAQHWRREWRLWYSWLLLLLL